MAISAIVLRERFSAHLRYTDSTRRRVEKLHQQGSLYRKDVETVYAGLFLDAFTAFERFIEELFLGLLSGNVTHRLASVSPRASFTSREALWGIVIGPKYADWLPYERTLKRAKAYFRAGVPFSRLNGPQEKRLEMLLAIRHVLAHKSYHSQLQFERKVISSHHHLTSQEKTPAGYLRSVYIAAPRTTRYEEAVSDLQVIAAALC